MFNRAAILRLLMGSLWINDLHEAENVQGEFISNGYVGTLWKLITNMPQSYLESGNVWNFCGAQISKERETNSTRDPEVDNAKFIVRFHGSLIYLYQSSNYNGVFAGAHDGEPNPYGLVGIYEYVTEDVINEVVPVVLTPEDLKHQVLVAQVTKELEPDTADIDNPCQ
jgi:hypothetical protein